MELSVQERPKKKWLNVIDGVCVCVCVCKWCERLGQMEVED